VTAAAAINRIREQMERIRSLCTGSETALFAPNERVSRWSVGEHLDHLLKSTQSVLKRIDSKDSLPSGVTLLGRVILTLGWIPRGRGKSPSRLGGMRVPLADLQAAVAQIEAALIGLDTERIDIARVPNVPHPRFGGLTPAQALRFTVIHNEHHLKIVRDILAAPR
jgi:hypothetical protein